MKKTYLIRVIVMTIAAALLARSPALAQDLNRGLTVKFSDPSRPGLLKVNWRNGSVNVKTHSSSDVVIQVRSNNRRPDPPEAAGLRRIDSGGPGPGVDSDTNNVISVNGPGSRGNGELEIEVPVKTNLSLLTTNGDTIRVDGVEGDFEVTNRNGRIVLTNVSGSVVAYSMNGDVTAALRDVTTGKPMSFTSMNGSVDVTLPTVVKANLKMRTDNGAVYSDFEIQLQASGQNQNTRQPDKNIAGTINGGGPDFDLRTHNGNIFLRKSTK